MNGSREIGFAVIATTWCWWRCSCPSPTCRATSDGCSASSASSVAAAVVFSALVALTLTPMMTSKLFAGASSAAAWPQAVDRAFQSLAPATTATRCAGRSAGARPVVAAVGSPVRRRRWSSCCWSSAGPGPACACPQELAPAEDRGRVQIFVQGPEGASLRVHERQLDQVAAIAYDEVERGNATRVIRRTGNCNNQADVSSGMVMLPLLPWGERPDTAEQIVRAHARAHRRTFPARAWCRARPAAWAATASRCRSCCRGRNTAQSRTWPTSVIAAAAAESRAWSTWKSTTRSGSRSCGWASTATRRRTSACRSPMSARALETMLGSRVVTTFLMGGDEYNVVLQARDDQRASVNDLDNIYVRSDKSGELVPLASVVTIQETGAASELRRFNRMRSVTVTANLNPGYSLGDALTYLEKVVREHAGQRAHPDRLRRRVARAEALLRRPVC